MLGMQNHQLSSCSPLHGSLGLPTGATVPSSIWHPYRGLIPRPAQHTSKVQEMSKWGDALGLLHVQNNSQVKLIHLLIGLQYVLTSSGCHE